MQKICYLLTDEGSVEDVRGVHDDKIINSDSKIIFEMIWTGLIQEIIDNIGLDTMHQASQITW